MEPTEEPTEDKPPASSPLPLYRAEALRAMESANQLDELLPVTSRRTWLIAVGAALLIIAAVAYAAVTPRDVTVEGSGRIVGREGVLLVSSSAAGQFAKYKVENESHVTAGQVVAEVVTASGPVPQYAQADGTIFLWGQRPGDPIDVGEWLAQLALTEDDGRTALMVIEPDDAGKVAVGMPIDVSVPTGQTTLTGTVEDAPTKPFSPKLVQEGLGMLEPPAGPTSVVVIQLEPAGPPGYEFSATVLVSKRTLLQQLLGLS